MKVLVTGANGFAGRWVVRALLAAGHAVVGATGPGGASALAAEEAARVTWVPFDLGDTGSARAVATGDYDAVLHLAAVASGRQALDDPGTAWTVNAAGTARLLHELGRRRGSGADPLVLLVSTGEVYGRAAASRPLRETDPTAPVSPYAAAKLGAEIAAGETARRTGLRVIVARAFPHTGPGQDERFVAPALARRLRLAASVGAPAVTVGNLDVVRDLLDVRDVAAAYLALLERGEPGATYNVASGSGVPLRDVFDRLAALTGARAVPEADAALMRPADLPYLVGDPAKLCAATGWAPRIPLEQTLRELVDAQAD